MDPQPAAAAGPQPAGGLRGLLGLAPEGPDEAGAMRLTLAIEDRVRQPVGLLHGGVHAAIAETLAVDGTLALTGRRDGVRAISTQTSFLRPVLQGSAHARAVPRHRGRTTWVWEAELSDGDGRLCSLVRVSVALD